MRVFLLSTFVLLAAHAAGCAPTLPVGKPVAGSYALELENTRWWLPLHAGIVDRRNIQLKKNQSGVYECTLVNPGKVLAQNGYKAGEKYCQVMRTFPGRYDGQFLNKGPGGTAVWQNGSLLIESDLIMRWTENGNDQWERLP